MEQHILRFKLITEGATEKVSQFIMTVYNKNLCIKEQKCIFVYCRMAIYDLILVLHQYTLLQWKHRACIWVCGNDSELKAEILFVCMHACMYVCVGMLLEHRRALCVGYVHVGRSEEVCECFWSKGRDRKREIMCVSMSFGNQRH